MRAQIKIRLYKEIISLVGYAGIDLLREIRKLAFGCYLIRAVYAAVAASISGGREALPIAHGVSRSIDGRHVQHEYDRQGGHN